MVVSNVLSQIIVRYKMENPPLNPDTEDESSPPLVTQTVQIAER